jgi:hypothetical protein
MKRKSTPTFWMAMAFGVALGLAAAVLAINGTDKKSLLIALQLTARWSFLLFWMAYAGGAMAALFGPAFEPLARRGRECGLAYAAAMLIHVGLVLWLFLMTFRPPLSGEGLIFFSIGIVWTYLMAIVSFGDLATALGSRGWRTLRFVGINYILLAFTVDFVPATIHGVAHYDVRRLFAYGPFAAMSFAAPFLVLAAAAHRRLGMRYTHARLGPAVD